MQWDCLRGGKLASGSSHQMAGAIAGTVMCVIDQRAEKSQGFNPLIAAFLGGLAGKLPDYLEPAAHPNHRQFFHSFLVLSGIACGMKSVYQWEPDKPWEKLVRGLLLVGGASYLSHLLLDSCTKKSLPLVGKL